MKMALCSAPSVADHRALFYDIWFVPDLFFLYHMKNVVVGSIILRFQKEISASEWGNFCKRTTSCSIYANG